MNPLVITLRVDEKSQEFFERERANYFPAGRTKVGAHVTLFHAVPGELHDDVERELNATAGPSFAVAVESVRSLGRGAAYFLASDELARRHRVLQQAWWPHLTSQDRQGFRPHVTVQNKLDAQTAARTVETMRATFVPFEVEAQGWSLWRYDDGPWTHLTDVAFD